jgi:hypothetical protein
MFMTESMLFAEILMITILYNDNENLLQTPTGIYKLCLMLFVIFCVSIPFLSRGYVGGDQRPLILLAYAVDVLVYGFFILSIFTTVLFWRWFKKHWYLNALIFVITGSLIIATTNLL